MNTKIIIRLTALVAVMLWTVAPVEAQSGSRGARQPNYRGSSAGRPGSPSSEVRRSAKPADSSKVRAASHSHVVEGEVIVDDYYDGDMGCDSCGGDGCDSCMVSSGFCGSCAAPHRFCICFPSHGWVHTEYLLWYQKGMRLPPLVTTGTTGTLADPTTSVLFGGNEVIDDESSGFRIRFGWWLSSIPGWGIEGEYVGLGEQTAGFSQFSAGAPLLARPFFNTLTGQEDAELVASTGVIGGRVTVDVRNKFDGAAVRFRKQMCCDSGCGYSQICCSTVPTSSRLDLTVGYRFWELDESLSINETLNAVTPAGTFVLDDRFETRNQFNGIEFGSVWQCRRGWWSLDALMRASIGNVHQTANLYGNTVITESGTTTTHADSGLLVQSSNAGTHQRDQFTVIPEFGLTLGYQMTKRFRATMGYSLVYWGNVLRPGDQVSLNVNTDLLAPANDPVTGALRPQFVFNETDYWVQGLSFGGEFRW